MADNVPKDDVAAFRLAWGMEEALAWVYAAARDVVSDDDARDVLAELARSEKGHADRLKRSYPELQDAVGSTEPIDSWTESRIRAAFVPGLDLSSRRDLLVSAFRLERCGRVFYRTWAVSSDSEGVRLLAADLAAQEELHAQRIADLYQRLEGAAIVDAEGALDPMPWPRLQ